MLLPVRLPGSPQLRGAHTEQPLAVGSRVVVQTPRGPQLAEVRGTPEQLPPTAPRVGEVLRAANADDEARGRELVRKAEDLKWLLRARVRELALPVKLVAVEFSLDEGLVTLSYAAEERVNLGALIGPLRAHTPARVNFSAVHAREQAMLLGALGSCGQENCSSRHLQTFANVSIRMVRDQQLPLNTDKLTGPCGRLMCCLQYEHAMYRELLGELPPKGSRACTVSGACGKVGKLNPLLGTAELHTEDGVLTVPAAELRPPPPDDESPTRS